MTLETKQLLDFNDIIALEFECKNEKCKTKFSFPIAKSNRVLECPICRTDWLMPQTREEEAIRLLIGALRDAAEALKGRAFNLRLQITMPSAKA